MSDRANIKKRWYKINAPLGRDLGYPECCLKEFGDCAPELMTGEPTRGDKRRFRAGHIDKIFTGFFPCNHHAKAILNNEITLGSLIKNRNVKFAPFPHEWH